jgi:hypothetical protein
MGFMYYTLNGQVDKYKVRLIAKGYSQVRSIHYTKTFSFVVKLSSNRIIMTLTVENDYKVHQIDIKIVFWMVNLRKKYIYETT